MPDLEVVQHWVQAANYKVKEKGLGVGKVEVILNMYSSVFPELTLLDMPGLINMWGASNHKDIVIKCKELVLDKAKGHNSAGSGQGWMEPPCATQQRAFAG